MRRAYDQLEAAGIILRNRPRGTRVADSFRAHPGPLENIGLITTLPHDFSGRFVEAVSRHARAADALLVLGIPEPDTGGEQLAIAVKMAARGVKDLIIWGADRSFDFRVFERLPDSRREHDLLRPGRAGSVRGLRRARQPGRPSKP